MIRNTSKSNEMSIILMVCLIALVITSVASVVFVMFQIALSRIINN